MKKVVLSALSLMMLFSMDLMAAATASFATSLPTSLLPTGFWTLVTLVFGVVVTIGGIVIGIKLMKRARG